MAQNGNYKIEIGINKATGHTAIGATAVKGIPAELRVSEYVYGVQIGHRVAAFDGKRWWLTTPTEARKDNTITRTLPFPR